MYINVLSAILLMEYMPNQIKSNHIIDNIHLFLFIDWLKVHHVIKNKLTILQK